MEKFLSFCKKKSLKLKTSKLNISEQVEFEGTLISSEIMGKEEFVCVLSKD